MIIQKLIAIKCQLYQTSITMHILLPLQNGINHKPQNQKKYDCITRTFAPKCNIVEDPVCGRAHAHLIQIWAKKLNKNNIHAYQASSRGGELFCTYNQERTIISGYATLYSSSDLNLL